MNNTSINWTDYSSNVIRARRLDNGKTGHFCTKKNSKCVNCYAEIINHRFGTGLAFDPRHRSKIEFFFAGHEAENLRQRNARLAVKGIVKKVFLSSMTDLFHETMPFDLIRKVFELIRDCRQLVFQTLTKRIDVAIEFFRRFPEFENLPNLWFGLTPEDDGSDIPRLRRIEAPVRWLSLEPLLRPLVLTTETAEYVKWIVIGGESGNKSVARAFNLQWARDLAAQSASLGIAVWFKQTGNNVYEQVNQNDDKKKFFIKGKGEEFELIPPDLQIRQFPFYASAA